MQGFSIFSVNYDKMADGSCAFKSCIASREYSDVAKVEHFGTTSISGWKLESFTKSQRCTQHSFHFIVQLLQSFSLSNFLFLYFTILLTNVIIFMRYSSQKNSMYLNRAANRFFFFNLDKCIFSNKKKLSRCQSAIFGKL